MTSVCEYSKDLTSINIESDAQSVASTKGGGSLSSLVQLSTSINFSPVPRLPPHAIIPWGFRFRAGRRSYVACGGSYSTYDL